MLPADRAVFDRYRLACLDVPYNGPHQRDQGLLAFLLDDQDLVRRLVKDVGDRSHDFVRRGDNRAADQVVVPVLTALQLARLFGPDDKFRTAQ